MTTVLAPPVGQTQVRISWWSDCVSQTIRASVRVVRVQTDRVVRVDPGDARLKLGGRRHLFSSTATTADRSAQTMSPTGRFSSLMACRDVTDLVLAVRRFLVCVIRWTIKTRTRPRMPCHSLSTRWPAK